MHSKKKQKAGVGGCGRDWKEQSDISWPLNGSPLAEGKTSASFLVNQKSYMRRKKKGKTLNQVQMTRCDIFAFRSLACNWNKQLLTALRRTALTA